MSGKSGRNAIYISCDVEASGKAPPYSMLSFGLSVVGEPSKSLYVELKPLNDLAEPGAMNVHKLTMDELKKNGLSPKEAMEAAKKWVAEVSQGRKAIFASWGTFDWMYMKWYLTNYGDPELFGHNSIEIKSFVAGVLGVPYDEMDSKTLKERLGIEFKNVHNALADAIEQGEILHACQLLNRQQKAERDSAMHGAVRNGTASSGRVALKG